MLQPLRLVTTAFALVVTGSATAAGQTTIAPDSHNKTQKTTDTKSEPTPEDLDKRRSTLWIFDGVMFEYRPGNTGSYSVSAGLGGVLDRGESSNSNTSLGTSTPNITIGWVVRGMYYPNNLQSGLGLGLSLGPAASGTYFAPGVYYVSRPKGGIVGRAGLSFPLGGDAVPVLPELGLGFRF